MFWDAKAHAHSITGPLLAENPSGSYLGLLARGRGRTVSGGCRQVRSLPSPEAAPSSQVAVVKYSWRSRRRGEAFVPRGGSRASARVPLAIDEAIATRAASGSSPRRVHQGGGSEGTDAGVVRGRWRRERQRHGGPDRSRDEEVVAACSPLGRLDLYPATEALSPQPALSGHSIIFCNDV